MNLDHLSGFVARENVSVGSLAKLGAHSIADKRLQFAGSDDDDRVPRPFLSASIDRLPNPGSAVTRRRLVGATDVGAIVSTFSVRKRQSLFDGSH